MTKKDPVPAETRRESEKVRHLSDSEAAAIVGGTGTYSEEEARAAGVTDQAKIK